MNKLYKVQLFNKETREWATESSFEECREAKKRCIEIVGEDYYSEPITQSVYETPEKDGYKWNGKEYMNEKGETKNAIYREVFYTSQGYFSNNREDCWICRISVL